MSMEPWTFPESLPCLASPSLLSALKPTSPACWSTTSTQATFPSASTACRMAYPRRTASVIGLIRVTESMGPALQQLLNQLNTTAETRVSCVVYDFTLWWVGRLGKELHIPAYISYPMSASFFSYLLHMPGFVSQGRLPLGTHTDLSDGSNMFKIPGFPALHVSEVPDISWDPNPVCSFDYLPRCAMRWRDATGMLLNSVYELEKEAMESLKKMGPELDIKAVGPTLPASFLKGEMNSSGAGGSSADQSAEAQRCLKWLDEQPDASVLYVAFGTIANLSEAQAQEPAMGLEASKERFLWVVRIPGQQQQKGLLSEKGRAGLSREQRGGGWYCGNWLHREIYWRIRR
ncbi:hypothetical protein L7F22_067304 [Adiantum nelumboides]|nr:hypothetical protein [Adiantum nelumboides]